MIHEAVSPMNFIIMIKNRHRNSDAKDLTYGSTANWGDKEEISCSTEAVQIVAKTLTISQGWGPGFLPLYPLPFILLVQPPTPAGICSIDIIHPLPMIPSQLPTRRISCPVSSTPFFPEPILTLIILDLIFSSWHTDTSTW